MLPADDPQVPGRLMPLLLWGSCVRPLNWATARLAWVLVGVAQLVEHLVVVQVVAGSSPVTHPKTEDPAGLPGLLFWDWLFCGAWEEVAGGGQQSPGVRPVPRRSASAADSCNGNSRTDIPTATHSNRRNTDKHCIATRGRPSLLTTRHGRRRQ